MSRTPLLRSIKQLLADYRAARHLKTDIDTVRHLRRHRRQALNRRDFLIGASTLAAAGTMPLSAIARDTSTSIAIIGGGMAGLTCALTLADRGIASTVYEASHRVGGRMFSNSQTWAEGQVSEWCGELIDTNHKTMHHLARRFNLPIDDLLASLPDGAETTYRFFDKYYTANDVENDFFTILDALDADIKAAGYPTRYDAYTPAGYRLDNTSIYDWIEQRVPGGHRSSLGQLLDVAYNIEYGAECGDQSSLNLLYLLGYQPSPNEFAIFGESDERYHIRGGNAQLPAAVAKHLGEETVQLGYRLQRIRKTSGQRYHLTFLVDNQRTEEKIVDAVVMAIPFSVLREIDYAEAEFSAKKDHAIQELGRGRNGKLQLQFDRRMWNNNGAWPGLGSGDSFTDAGYQCSWDVTRAQPGDAGILVFYSGGDTAGNMLTQRAFAGINHGPVLQDANNALAQAESVFPGISAHWNGRATQSLPHLSPLFRASYAYYRVGQYTAFGGVEGEREHNVFFCGDHTSQDFQGFMEGAASEGVRVGKELARKLR